MLNDNATNLPAVKAVPLCWKCEGGMVRDEANKQWKCPTHADVVQPFDAQPKKQGGGAYIAVMGILSANILLCAVVAWLVLS